MFKKIEENRNIIRKNGRFNIESNVTSKYEKTTMLKHKIQVIGLVANYTVKKKKSGNLNIWQRNINRLKKKNRASNIFEVEVSEKR